MARWDYRYLGAERFPESLSALEIEQFFALDEAGLTQVGQRRGPMNRLAVALQIGFLKMTGTLLNSVQLVPAAVLEFAWRQTGDHQAAPRIASIRALYRRRRTLFDHHQLALTVLGFRHLSEQAESGLIAALRRDATDTFDIEALVSRGRVWLYEHQYMMLPLRRLRRMAVAARRHHDALITARIGELVPAGLDAVWLPRLLEAASAETEVSRLDWLRDGPRSKKPGGLADHFEKVSFLKSLGADLLRLNLPLAGIRHFARPMLYRKPAAVARMRIPVDREHGFRLIVNINSSRS